MQVVDLAARKVAGPVTTPTQVGTPGPFSWLVGAAYAGGVASTVPVSPDGLWLYSGAADAVMVLRVPDLAAMRKIGVGASVNEVWISGDGRTIYVTTAHDTIVVMREDGTGKGSATIGTNMGAFIASEHG